jgi:hypothetical protein
VFVEVGDAFRAFQDCFRRSNCENAEKSLRGRVKTFIQKLLFKRVHRFILYFRDLRGCEKFYGIGADRAVFVPFKVNAIGFD